MTRLAATYKAARAEFSGWMLSKGWRPDDLTVMEFCDLIYWRLIEHADDKRKGEVDSKLFRPPPGTEISPEELEGTVWSRDEELASFQALMMEASQAEPSSAPEVGVPSQQPDPE